MVGVGGFWRVGREHFQGKLGGPEGNFVKVAMVGVHLLALFAYFALALLCSVTEWSKQRLPFFLGFSGKCMGIVSEIHKRKN